MTEKRKMLSFEELIKFHVQKAVVDQVEVVAEVEMERRLMRKVFLPSN